MTSREVVELIRPTPASDGEGVKLLRIFGGRQPERFDPFLLLDEFGSSVPEDYSGGFPPHPHRGFETVTYMLHGKMEHRDHLGNVGLLEDGGVQWMTAGRGVIHSEMPKQTEGLMQGFQLWVNLPAARKMDSAGYRDVPADAIPRYALPGAHIKAIAGECLVDGEPVQGYFAIEDTDVIYLHILLDPAGGLNVELDAGYTCLLYVAGGTLTVGEAGTAVSAKALARLTRGERTCLNNRGSEPVSALLLAGAPLGEPVAQYGPFVMNSREEVEQAFRDYQSGTLTD